MLDLPRFLILAHDADLDVWSVAASQLRFESAVWEYERLRGKGCNVYLVAAGFIAGPSTSVGTMRKLESATAAYDGAGKPGGRT